MLDRSRKNKRVRVQPYRLTLDDEIGVLGEYVVCVRRFGVYIHFVSNVEHVVPSVDDPTHLVHVPVTERYDVRVLGGSQRIDFDFYWFAVSVTVRDSLCDVYYPLVPIESSHTASPP